MQRVKFCREGADKLQYELSLYLAIQQSVEHLRAAEAEPAEVAATAPEVSATAAAAVGRPRGRAVRRAGAAPALKAVAGTGSGTRLGAARQHGQAGLCQAQPTSDCNSDIKAARQSKQALQTAEPATCKSRAQAAAEDKGLVAGGGAARGQAADVAAQAARAGTEPAEADAQAPAEAAAQVPAAGSRKRGRPCKAPAAVPAQALAEAAAQVPAAGSRRRGRPCKAPAEAAAQAPAEAAAQVPAAGCRRGRPHKEPATAVRSQSMVLCQEYSAPSLLGKRAADGGQPGSSPRAKQTCRESPVIKPEDGGAPAGGLSCAESHTPPSAEATADGAGFLGGAEGRTPFTAEATADGAGFLGGAEGVGAAVLPSAEPAAGVPCTQGQTCRSPAVEPKAEGAPAQLLVGAGGSTEGQKHRSPAAQPGATGAPAQFLDGAEDTAPPGAADAAEDAGAECTSQADATAAADEAGTRDLLAARRATAGGAGHETPVGANVGRGNNLTAADIGHGGRGPAAEAAADLEAIAALGLGQATAANVPEDGAIPWAASGFGPPLPTFEAVAATIAAAVKADDAGALAGPATAALRSAVSGGNCLVPTRSGCPKSTPKSRLARTAGSAWGSLFGWASC